jgi:molecular chaperone Hsp33
MQKKGYVLPFILDQGAVRGRLIRLGTEFSDLTDKHNYPPCVNRILGELLVVGSALITDLKTHGKMTLQITNGAIIKMIVAEITSDGHMRGCARFDEAALDAFLVNNPKAPFDQLFAGGQFVFTVSFDDSSERQQAIVELNGATLAECIEHYFKQSDQVHTSLVMFSNEYTVMYEAENVTQFRPYKVGAIMLQQMPGSDPMGDPEGGQTQQADDWVTYTTLLSTLKEDEMLSPALSPEIVLHRLFHEHQPMVFAPKGLIAQCSCSKARLQEVIATFDAAAVEEMLVDGVLEAGCQFCGTVYTFTKDELNLNNI